MTIDPRRDIRSQALTAALTYFAIGNGLGRDVPVPSSDLTVVSVLTIAEHFRHYIELGKVPS